MDALDSINQDKICDMRDHPVRVFEGGGALALDAAYLSDIQELDG